jgi:hypothetical protein
MAPWDPIYSLDNTKRNSFKLSIIVNVDSDIFTVASLKTDSIDMEFIEQSEEKKRQRKKPFAKIWTK